MTSQVNKVENAKITKNHNYFFTIFLILNTNMTKAKN